MTTSKFKRLGLPTALVVGGVTAGSFLAPIGLASAQTDDTDAETDATTEESDTDATAEDSDAESTEDDHQGRRGQRRGARNEAVTDALGLTKEEIRQGFEDGKSLADMAEEQGIAVEDLRSAMIDAASEHLDAAVEAERLTEDEAAEKLAELEAGIDERLTTVPDLSEREGRGHGRRGGGASLEALEETLGLSGEEIRASLSEGNTLADIAEAQGVSVEDLADQLIASMEERLDAAVEDGKIDEDRAEEIREGLEEKVDERLNSEFDGSRDGAGRGHRGNRGDRGNRGQDSGGETTDTAATAEV